MQRGVGHVGQADSLQDWFASIPIITKIFFVSTLISGATLSFNIVSADQLILLWPLIVKKFQVWRLFTAFVYAGKFSFNFAMHVWVLYDNFRRYELDAYDTGAGGNSADVLYMVLLAMALLLGIGYIWEMYVLSEAILYVVLYVWSKKVPEQVLSIMGMRIKALYLPVSPHPPPPLTLPL